MNVKVLISYLLLDSIQYATNGVFKLCTTTSPKLREIAPSYSMQWSRTWFALQLFMSGVMLIMSVILAETSMKCVKNVSPLWKMQGHHLRWDYFKPWGCCKLLSVAIVASSSFVEIVTLNPSFPWESCGVQYLSLGLLGRSIISLNTISNAFI